LLRIQFSEDRLRLPGPAIFLDRDGVINCRKPASYVLHWSEFLFIPGIPAALQQLATLHLPMIVISNQACVGKGLLDSAGLQEITVRMHHNLADIGAFVAAVYYCIHRSDENCACRKPKPGLLQNAAEDYNIDLKQSIFIGDSDTDIRAGLAAGCKPILFGTTHPENSGYSVPVNGISAARTAADLFTISEKCLKACSHLEPSGDSV
jgi:D-glycero-D-manno-heptose 1,7-bisphosphate phosphatase